MQRRREDSRAGLTEMCVSIYWRVSAAVHNNRVLEQAVTKDMGDQMKLWLIPTIWLSTGHSQSTDLLIARAPTEYFFASKQA